MVSFINLITLLLGSPTQNSNLINSICEPIIRSNNKWLQRGSNHLIGSSIVHHCYENECLEQNVDSMKVDEKIIMLLEQDASSMAQKILSLSIIHVIMFLTNSVFLEPNPAFATTFDDYFSTSSTKYQDPLKVKARKQLNDLKNLEDSRLELCADKGKNWEQCFMFGESPTLQSGNKKKKIEIRPLPDNRGNTMDELNSSKSTTIKSPPTW